MGERVEDRGRLGRVTLGDGAVPLEADDAKAPGPARDREPLNALSSPGGGR
jgi:hypothetical protein